MTEAQKTVKHLQNVLEEHCDGFCLVAFSTDGEPLTAVSAPTGKTECALNAFMGSILAAGGVGAILQKIKDAQKENE